MVSANIIIARIPRIMSEPDGPAWFVVIGSYGWLFGSRREAIRAARDLITEVS